MKINELMMENLTDYEELDDDRRYLKQTRDLLGFVNSRDALLASKVFQSLNRFAVLGSVLHFLVYHVQDKADAKWFFDLEKQVIVKKLLQEIKEANNEDDEDDLYAYPKQLVHYLRKAKVDWPELDIIQKSLIADKKLDEDTDSDEILYYYWDNFLYSLKDFEVHTAMNDLRRYLKAGGSKEKAKDALEKYKEKIIKSVLLQLSYGHVSLLNTLSPLMHQVGIDWPELDLDNNKESIIKNLLNLTKKQQYSVVANAVDSLHKHNVDWSELDIINRSLKADKMVSEDDGLADWQLRHMLDDTIINLHTPGNISTAILWLRKYMAHNGDIDKVKPEFIKYKDKIIAYLKQKSAAGEFINVDEAVEALKKMNIAWPELDTVYDDNKEAIVKRILWKYRHHNPMDTEKMVANLRKRGIDWPELDIIERSLNAGK